MGEAEILIAGLLVAVAGLSARPPPLGAVSDRARRRRCLFGFVPGLPQVKLDPEVVLFVFLPPFLYGESIFANFRNFRTNTPG